MSLTNQIARTIANGFNAMHADFQNITLAAKARFERDNWHAVDKAQRDRLSVYNDKVESLLALLRDLAGSHIDELELWQAVREAFVQLTKHSTNIEIAESFYNSVFRKFFKLSELNDQTAFVFNTITTDKQSLPEFNSFQYHKSDIQHNQQVIRSCLSSYQFNSNFETLNESIIKLCKALDKTLELHCDAEHVTIKMIDTVFYRNKGAYLIGAINCCTNDAPQKIPFAISLTKVERKNSSSLDEQTRIPASNTAINIDALIDDVDEISIIFSFSRTYFMVDSESPNTIVNFLSSIMPHKKTYELYTSIGYRRHGKSLFYRDFLRHLQQSDDQFILAPGIKGMVMSVFTLPSYDVVFKIIKDKFTPPKNVTHQIVKQKYSLVTTNDRAGRLADTQEFLNYRLPINRFSDELLTELKEVAPSAFSIEGDDIIMHHLYTERRMVPLNIYLKDADEEQLHSVMDDYGKSIKEMAAANIFPGDMLLKNFGVTRHDRVIFYDYDEICFMTECNFRAIPEPKTEEQTMSNQPWYHVAENDIFPEEFSLFFSGNPRAKEVFEELHSDLYEAKTWQQIQQQIIDEVTPDVFPYLPHFKL